MLSITTHSAIKVKCHKLSADVLRYFTHARAQFQLFREANSSMAG